MLITVLRGTGMSVKLVRRALDKPDVAPALLRQHSAEVRHPGRTGRAAAARSRARPAADRRALRHTAATTMISSRVPLAVVSTTLRHSTLATTVNLYGHLLPHAAAIGTALERADRKHATANPGGQSEKRAA
ncbi:integrase [Streptomyces demainii]|uniref:Integrase n=1 Tax=Streptomyces demainii TaxID=588122 RepID=A0ABT9KRY6_9ACTN|nr:integrase [Streptomyces demainii]